MYCLSRNITLHVQSLSLSLLAFYWFRRNRRAKMKERVSCLQSVPRGVSKLFGAWWGNKKRWKKLLRFKCISWSSESFHPSWELWWCERWTQLRTGREIRRGRQPGLLRRRSGCRRSTGSGMSRSRTARSCLFGWILEGYFSLLAF